LSIIGFPNQGVNVYCFSKKDLTMNQIVLSDNKLDILVVGELNPDLILRGVVPEFGQVEKIVDDANPDHWQLICNIRLWSG
jgi:hypothetical protein